jgi:hypothetical protein
MKRGKFQFRHYAVLLILAFLVSLVSAGPTDTGDSMRKLTEADRIGRDRQFTGDMQSDKSADSIVGYTRQLVNRGYNLAERLRSMSASESLLGPLVTKLKQFDTRPEVLESGGDASVDELRRIYLDVRWTVRRIAFCNPLLDFDKILFIKRHDSGGVFHMCDQYSGCNARPIGGLFILSDPFGSNPKMTNVLQNSVVERGRLMGDFVWPEGTTIKSLRIIQALPKTTPPPNRPRIGIANQTNARAVLGTVPVEADGSAYFKAPIGKAIYFQALDERGMATQSMRSATYVHPGEQLTCLGCHEPNHRVPKHTTSRPSALMRPPSKIESDVDGSNPFNYVRLVQPVLERNCVSCHRQKKALDLSGEIEGNNGWIRSYNNLAGKYAFLLQRL